MFVDIKIVYERKADKFLAKNQHRLSKKDADKLILSAVKKISGDPSVNINITKMKSRSKGKYRIRTKNIRIIFHLERGEIYVVSVEEIGFRGDIYQMRETAGVYQTGA